ncbi:hypothetical protein [Streptomyces ziwulingensis]|uniref:hypothetical protein n=1 Tax=Streptomyces ziwulingensis TaxID=1045501 RepID=UPI0031ECF3CB
MFVTPEPARTEELAAVPSGAGVAVAGVDTTATITAATTAATTAARPVVSPPR